MTIFFSILQVGLGLFVLYLLGLLAWVLTLAAIGFLKVQGRR